MLNTYLNKIITSTVFAKSKRQRELLTYLIKQMNDGNGSRIKGYVIALEVFDRNENFDPSVDAIVRVEVGRLRNKLREYYDTVGFNDPIEVSLPKGSYGIQIINREIGKDEESKKLNETPTRVSTPKIAVMPFNIIDGSDINSSLVPEIADSIIFDLVDLDSIYLISRQVSFSEKHSGILPNETANLLGAQYLIEGSIRNVGNNLLLMVRIFDYLKNSYVWFERYTFELEEKSENFRTIARRIYKFLIDEISPINSEVFDLKNAVSPKAQQLVIKGMESFWKYSPKHIENAKKYFQNAIRIETGYSSANAWLARTIVYEYIANYKDAFKNLEDAQYYAEKAYQISPRSSYALAVLGWVHMWTKHGDLSLRYAREAVLIDPDNTEALSFLSMILTSQGNCDEGLIYAKRANELNHFPSHINKFSLGFALFGLRRYQEAIDAFKVGCNINSTYLPNFVYLGLSKSALGIENKLVSIREKLLCMVGGNIDKLCISYFVEENLRAFDLDLRKKAGFISMH